MEDSIFSNPKKQMKCQFKTKECVTERNRKLQR